MKTIFILCALLPLMRGVELEDALEGLKIAKRELPRLEGALEGLKIAKRELPRVMNNVLWRSPVSELEKGE
ncbi:unnamed protein product, partial [Iphiclides podalirius]